MITKNALKIKNNGFTLIELLVVMAMIGIVFSSTVAIFTRFNQQQNITLGAKALRTDLAEAKSNAASNVVNHCKSATDPDFGPGDYVGILRGYQLSRDTTTTNRYRLFERCETSPGNIVSLTPHLKEKTLPAGITFTNNFSISFDTLGRNSSGGSITIQGSTGSIPISVTSQGVIQ